MAMHEHIRKLIKSATTPGEDDRRTGDFKDAILDNSLSRDAQILAMAENAKHEEGHEAVLSAFIAFGGTESEYDPARWELMREGYPANRGW